MRTESDVLEQIREWAERWDNIRAVVLTGSRGEPGAPVDVLSDYDVEIYMRDVEPVLRDDAWLGQFGSIMVRWPLRPQPTFDDRWITQLVLFEDGVRIDFQFSSSELDGLARPAGPFRVIVDKDRLAPRLPSGPSPHRAQGPPTADEFHDRLDAFWWDIPYVPKALRRGELNYAKFVMDGPIRFEQLLPLMRWYVGATCGWSSDIGVYGRRLHRYLDESIWARYLETFSGADIDDNWSALFAMLELVRTVGVSLADSLGYDYPHDVDTKVTSYINRIYEMDADELTSAEFTDG